MLSLLFAIFAISICYTSAVSRFPLIPSVMEATPRIEDLESVRLPNNTRPETYEIAIRTWIHDGNFTFTGSVRIGIVAVESTNFIRLHHRVQTIERIEVFSEDQIPINIGDSSHDIELDFLTIPVIGNTLVEGSRYFIVIDYIGTMVRDSDPWRSGGFLGGFYNINGLQRFYGSTHFQPLDARKAFPSYDEPSLKSTFSIRITHDSSYTAISNMPAISEQRHLDGSTTTTFETTPKMSTYLVAFHVSDFLNISSTSQQSIPHRIFSRPNAPNQGRNALELGNALMDAFHKYIGVEYSLPKLDQIAFSGLGAAGMENWGLVSYQEYYLLFNETVDHYTQRLNAVLVNSHELAHQWFGNLVSPRWWTYTWLNEGFATFYEYLGLDLVYPDWNMMDFFVVNILHNALTYDQGGHSRPMTYYVENKYDISSQFSYVGYHKAGSVLRMFWFMFGEETFKRGVKIYLQTNEFSDVGEEELFEALDISVSSETEDLLPPNVDVPTVMASWSRQPGLPLITVERNYDDRTDQVILKQERYFENPAMNPDNLTWWVPYNFATPKNPGFESTLVEGWIPQDSNSIEIVVDSLGPNDYLLINKRAAGYYRIIYDERNYRMISDAILRNNSLFHTTNKAQLFNDVIEFIRAGRLSYKPLLDLLRVLEFDSNYVSWYHPILAIRDINQNFRGHRNYPIWEDFVRGLIEKLYDSVGIADIPNEPILLNTARRYAIQIACQMGSVHCRSDASRELRRNIENGQDFDPYISYVLFCASVHSASRTDFHNLWNRMMSYPIEQISQRSEIIRALGCSASRPLLNELLRSSLNSTNSNNVTYTRNEVNLIFNVVRSGGGGVGHIGLDLTLDFLIENAEEAYETYGLDALMELSNVVSRADHIDRFRLFQNILLDADLITQSHIDRNEDRIADSLKWLNTFGEVINMWLMENHM